MFFKQLPPKKRKEKKEKEKGSFENLEKKHKKRGVLSSNQHTLLGVTTNKPTDVHINLAIYNTHPPAAPLCLLLPRWFRLAECKPCCRGRQAQIKTTKRGSSTRLSFSLGLLHCVVVVISFSSSTSS